MEKIQIPKIRPLYSKDELLELTCRLNNDSKTVSAKAENEIKQHIFSFCNQFYYDGILKYERMLTCFRAKQYFKDNDIMSMAVIYSNCPEKFNVVFAFNEFRCIDKENNRCLAIFNFNSITDENFLIDCIRGAHIKAKESLEKSIKIAKDDIERFQKDINALMEAYATI